MATPFVQGRLRNEFLAVRIDTSCAHCDRPMTLELDSELQGGFAQRNARPLVHIPAVNFAELTTPSIIDPF